MTDTDTRALVEKARAYAKEDAAVAVKAPPGLTFTGRLRFAGGDVVALADALTAKDAELTALRAECVGVLNGMLDAYWRGSEDSSDEEAPSMVKDALNLVSILTQAEES